MKILVTLVLLLAFAPMAVAQDQVVAKLGVLFNGQFNPTYIELYKSGVLTKSVYGHVSSLKLSKMNMYHLNNLASKMAEAKLDKDTHRTLCLMATLPLRDLFVADDTGSLKVVLTPRGDCTVGEEARPTSPTRLEEAAELKGALEALADQF